MNPGPKGESCSTCYYADDLRADGSMACHSDHLMAAVGEWSEQHKGDLYVPPHVRVKDPYGQWCSGWLKI